MSNSVFHNIYTEKITKATQNVFEENYSTSSALYLMYLSTVINTFTWKNLPKTVLPFAPETSLCYWGLYGAFKDNGELKMFPAYPSGELLENGEFSKYILIARNGKTFERSREEIALCYNNSLRIPSLPFINEFAEKSNNALRAVDCALERVLIPPIIECETEEDMKRISDLYDRTKNQLPFRLTFRDNGFGAQGSKINEVFDSRKYDVIAMWDVYVRYRNLFYTTFGINNVEIQKRERLTEAEGSGNDEITRYTFLNDMYNRRLDFKKEVEEKFSHSLDIELNRDSATVYNLSLDNMEKVDGVELNLMRGINLKNTENTSDNGGKEDVETDIN